MRRVLVIGCNGQDGQLLSRSLKDSGSIVYGITNPLGNQELGGEHCTEILSVDFTNLQIVESILTKLEPSVIFHLASVNVNSYERKTRESITRGERAREVQVGITGNVLSSIEKNSPSTRFILAGSSRMYSADGGRKLVSRDTTPAPIDGYGVYKTEAHSLVTRARSNGLNAATAILFNHESHLRKPGFLFPHLAEQISQVLNQNQKEIRVMDANAMSDWHAAEDTVKGLIKMADQNVMEDYVFASGKASSVGELVAEYFRQYHGSKSPPIVSTSPQADRGVLIGDTRETLRDLEWQTEVPILSILDKIVRRGSK